jgi:hypothetical protein
MKRFIHASLALILSLSLAGCGLLESEDEGPNSMGGDPNLEMSKQGAVWDAWVDLSDVFPEGYEFTDDVKVLKNENGIVTMDVNIAFEDKILEALDTLAGTSGLPLQAKLAVLDQLLDRYGVTLDTVSQPGTIKLHAQPKFKVTSEGIQEFVSGDGDLSKPFTIVKYGMNVGDTWSFTDKEGVTITRKVVHKSTTDDYPLYFWLFKVSKVESIRANDPLLEKTTFIANHKYGPFGAVVRFKNGKELKIGVVSPTL